MAASSFGFKFKLSWAVIMATLTSALSTPTAHSIYRILAEVQNGTAHARFEIDTPRGNLGDQSRLTLDAPQLNTINASVYDWWYFDAVAEDNPHESLVVAFFTSSVAAFPFLDPKEESVLNVFVWASFANGSSWAVSTPATLATVSIGGEFNASSSSGFGRKLASGGMLWKRIYRFMRFPSMPRSSQSRASWVWLRCVLHPSPSLSPGLFFVLTFSQRAPPHLPCGINSDTTSLQVAPNIGWVNLVPDAVGSVDVTIRGTRLKFQGAAYHDKVRGDSSLSSEDMTG